MLCVSAGWALVGQVAAEVKINSSTFGGIEARAIGPAVMGGRISAMDAVWRDRLTICPAVI